VLACERILALKPRFRCVVAEMGEVSFVAAADEQLVHKCARPGGPKNIRICAAPYSVLLQKDHSERDDIILSASESA